MTQNKKSLFLYLQSDCDDLWSLYLAYDGYTPNCMRNNMAFTEHVPAPVCLTEGEKRNLIKTTETSSYHIQDAQEGGRTPPTNPGTRGQTPAERSPETQDAASLAASKVSCPLILHVFKLPEELPVYHSIFTVFLLI